MCDSEPVELVTTGIEAMLERIERTTDDLTAKVANIDANAQAMRADLERLRPVVDVIEGMGDIELTPAGMIRALMGKG
jgi:hypothetical protein